MKKPTNTEIANDYRLWGQYVDPSGLDTEAKFNAMSEAEKLACIARCFGTEDDDCELRDLLQDQAQAHALPATEYTITDGNATETATTLDDAASIAEEWYDYLLSAKRLEQLPPPNLDGSSLDALNDSIAKWEERIAEAMGKKSWAGHGNYYVTAASEAGLNLVVRINE